MSKEPFSRNGKKKQFLEGGSFFDWKKHPSASEQNVLIY